MVDAAAPAYQLEVCLTLICWVDAAKEREHV